jgi:RHS repeat-associated protein
VRAILLLFLLSALVLSARGVVADEIRQGPPIESLMRAAQARYEAVNATPYAWKVGCECDGTRVPAYPPDGYFRDLPLNRELAVRIVQDVAGVLNNFEIRNRYATLESVESVRAGGGSGLLPVNQLSSYCPDCIGDVNDDNLEAKISALWQAINKLRYIRATPTYVDCQSSHSTWVSTGICVSPGPGYTCFTGFPPIGINDPSGPIDTAASALFGGGGLGEMQCGELTLGPCIEPLIVPWQSTQVCGSVGFSSGLTLRSALSGSDIVYWVEGGTPFYSALRGRFRFATSTPGNATVFVKGTSWNSASRAIQCPFTENDSFSQFATFRSGSVWTSELVGDIAPANYLSADIRGVQWQVTDCIAVIEPDFDATPTSNAKCGELSSENCTTCSSSGATGKLGSVAWEFNLGTDAWGKSLGHLALSSATLATVDVATPARLYARGPVWDSSGVDPYFATLPHNFPPALTRQFVTSSILVSIENLVPPGTNGSEFGFSLAVYPSGSYSATVNAQGLRDVGGDPLVVFDIVQSNATVDHPISQIPTQGSKLTITRRSGSTVQYFWTWTQAEEAWSHQEGRGAGPSASMASEVMDRTYMTLNDGNLETSETRYILNPPNAVGSYGTVADVTVRKYRTLSPGNKTYVLVQSVKDPLGANLITRYEYDQSPTSKSYGSLVSSIDPNGHWTQYIYNATTGRLEKVRSSTSGSAFGDPINCEERLFRYFTVSLSGDSIPDKVIEETIQIVGMPVSRTLSISWGLPANSNWQLPQRTRTATIRLATAADESSNYATLINQALADPRLASHQVTFSSRWAGPSSGAWSDWNAMYSTDGIVQFDRPTTFSGGGVERITYRGQLASPVNVHAIGSQPFNTSMLAVGYGKTVTRTNSLGTIVYEMTYSQLGSGAEVAVKGRHAVEFQTLGLAQVVTKYRTLAGELQDEDLEYSCCDLVATIDAAGIRTEYERDDLGRIIVERRQVESTQFISSRYRYDGAGRIRSVVRRGTDNAASSEILDEATTYDLAGRVASFYKSRKGTSSITELTSNGRVVRTTMLQDPDGNGPEAAPVIVERSFPDGRPEAREGSGVFPRRYEYGVVVDSDPLAALGGFAARVTKIVAVGGGGTSTEWTSEYQNQFGRVYKRVTADGATTRQTFDSAGRLQSTTDPDGVVTLHRRRGDNDASVAAAIQFALDSAAADWSLTAVDMDRDGQVDFSSLAADAAGSLADRVSLDQRFTVNDANGTWRVQSTKEWAEASNAGVATPVSVSRNRADGLVTESTSHGRRVVTSITRSRSNGSVRVDVFSPDNTSSASTSSYGLERSIATFGNVAGELPLTQLWYFYDEFGRRNQVTDTRGTLSTTDDRISYVTFNNVGLPITSTTPEPAAGEPTQTTTTTYDALGRVTRLDLPDGGSQHTAYLPNGKVKKTYGARMYASEYTYDAQGRMKTLTTWKDFNESTGMGTSGAAVTTWTYSPTRGFLTSKTYDANQPGPSYTYTPAGRLMTRTWARGVVTSYGYNNAGQLFSVNYSDDTPDVVMQFDRRGRTTAITDAVGARTLSYASDGSLLTEDFSAGWLDEISQHSGYDSFGRRVSFELRKAGVAQSTIGYGYDPQSGRYAFVTKAGIRADYGYESGGERVNSLVFRNGTSANSTVMLTTSRNIDAISRVRTISHDSVLGTDESYTYSYDAANERTRLDLIDGSSWVYQYDSMGQVVGGKRYKDGGAAPVNPIPGQQFEYGFDDIGNRTLAKMGGNTTGGGLRTTTYTSNALNQYTERNNNRSSDIMGYAPANNSVLVKGSPADYRWNRFYQELIPRTSGGSVLELIDIEWNAQSAGPEDWRGVIVPPTLEKYLYDADGNMTQDGRWKYFWDAENRLIRMETRPNLDSSIPKRKLEFGYDYASRRVRSDAFGWLDIEVNPDPGEGGVIVEDEGAGSSGGGSTGEPDPNAPPSGFWELDGTAFYLWDGWNMVAHLGGFLNFYQSYAWGLDLSQSEQGAGGVGGLLFLTEHNNNWTRFTTYDGNGNVTTYRAAAGDYTHAPGVVVGAYEYGPFGEAVASDGLYRSSYPFRFSTKFQDAESGLLYYGYRYYHAGMGRWLNRDPIGINGGLNVLGAMRNALTNRYDFRGLDDFAEGPSSDPPHGWDNGFSYDPNVRPNSADFSALTKYEMLLEGAKLLGHLPDATRAYEHYLSGKGTDLSIDYERFLRDNPIGRTRLNEEIEAAQIAAEAIAATKSGQRPSSFEIYSRKIRQSDSETENWEKTIGGHQIWGEGTVTVDMEGCKRRYKMKLRVKIEDFYNFNRGQFDIATGLPDDENGRFEVLGWAKSFYTRGEIIREVTWTGGDISRSTQVDGQSIMRGAERRRSRR